jgi:hypothetical protein
MRVRSTVLVVAVALCLLHGADAKKKKWVPQSAAALAAAAAEAAARADMEAAKQEAIEAKKPKKEAEPLPFGFCENCLRGTSGPCITEMKVCRPKMKNGKCPIGTKSCEPERAKCAEFDNQVSDPR